MKPSWVKSYLKTSAVLCFCCLRPTPVTLSAESPLFPRSKIPHRFLQVAAGQLAVLGVVIENRAQLKMCPSLDPLRRLKLKNGL